MVIVEWRSSACRLRGSEQLILLSVVILGAWASSPVNDAVALAAAAGTRVQYAAAERACAALLSPLAPGAELSVGHTCLGVLMFRQQNMSGAVWHLRRAQSFVRDDAVAEEYLGAVAMFAARALSRDGSV